MPIVELLLVTSHAEMGGRTIPAGSQALLMVGSANRDDTVFPNADHYDLDRDTSQTLSFGVGRHYCLGAHLARLEATITLGYLRDQTTAYDVDVDAAQRVHSINVRGFRTLPITTKPR